MSYNVYCSPRQWVGAQHSAESVRGRGTAAAEPGHWASLWGAADARGCLLAGRRAWRASGVKEMSSLVQKLSFRNVDGLNTLKIMTLERNWCRCLAIGNETGSRMMAQDAERFASPPGLCY